MKCPSCNKTWAISKSVKRFRCCGGLTPFGERDYICTHCNKNKDNHCIVLQEQGKTGYIYHERGIYNPKARCPLGKWGPPELMLFHISPTPRRTAIQRRNLIYHICPIGDWRCNVDRIKPELFHRKVIAIVHGEGLEDTQVVKDYIPFDAEILELPNDKRLREVATFEALLTEVESSSPEEASFYAHTKGNTTADNPTAAVAWREVMYDSLMNEEATTHLQTHAFVGTHKLVWPGESPFPSKLVPRYSWMHCGTFYWFRHDVVFNRDWRSLIADDRYGAEAFPAQIIPHQQAKSLWQPWREHESAWPQKNPYDPSLYGQSTQQYAPQNNCCDRNS